MKTQVELLKECCDIKDAACVRYQKRIDELLEENKKLKEDLHFERNMLDNVSAEYDSLQNVIKELKEIMCDILYRVTKHNIKNVVYKWEEIEIWDWDYDYTLD